MKKYYILSFLLLFIIKNIWANSNNVDSLLHEFNKTNVPEKKTDLLIDLAEIYLFGNLDTALLYSQKALDIANIADYRQGEINALIVMADIYIELGEYKKVESFINAIEKYSNSSLNKRLKAKLYLLKGINGFYSNSYNYALDCYTKSLSLYKASNDFIGMGDVYRKLSQIFNYWQEFEIMHQCDIYTLKCYQRAEYNKGLAAAFGNLGAYYFLTKSDLSKAEYYIHKAMNLNRINLNNYWLSKDYVVMASIKENLNQTDSVFYYIESSLDLAKKLDNPCWESVVLMFLGSHNLNIQKYNQSLNNFYEARKLAEKLNNYQNLASISNFIQYIYYGLGKIDSAYSYQKKYFIYNDSLNQFNNRAKFAELKYELEKQFKQQQIELNRDKRLYINLTIFISLGLVIIILLLTYMQQKSKIKNNLLLNKLLLDKIELKNKKLVYNALFSVRKIESISSIVENIKKNKDLFSQKSLEILDEVVKNLNNAIEGKEWDNFDTIFRQIHESFFEKIEKSFPELSQKERRLCALLRLDMSTKEIAEITQLLPKSIDSARYRLRKKLGIENQETGLTTFLRKL